MHIIDKLKNYSRLSWSTEACWHISRFPIDRNAEFCIHGVQDIISVNKEGLLTNLTAYRSQSNQMHIIDKLKLHPIILVNEGLLKKKSHGF